MTDRLEIENQLDNDLRKMLGGIKWPINYGNIRIQIRNGKPTLVAIEKTVKLD